MIIAVTLILSVAGIFLGLMFLALVMEIAWPALTIIAALLIIRDMIRTRSDQGSVASGSKM